MRHYTRQVRKAWPKMGEQLAAHAQAKIAATHRAIRVAWTVRAFAWAGLLACGIALTCVAR